MRLPLSARLALATALALPLGSCVVAAATGAGVLIAQERLDNNVFESRLANDVSVVWPVARDVLASESSSALEIDATTRTAVGKVAGGRVSISVEAYDMDVSILRVWARSRLGMNDGETARRVQNRIIELLDAGRPRDAAASR